MATIHKVKRDRQTRKYYIKTELNINLTKYNILSRTLNSSEKCLFFQQLIDRFHVNSSLCRINNRCLFSGRSHWILRRFRTSRMMFKTLFDKGLIFGVKRHA